MIDDKNKRNTTFFKVVFLLLINDLIIKDKIPIITHAILLKNCPSSAVSPKIKKLKYNYLQYSHLIMYIFQFTFVNVTKDLQPSHFFSDVTGRVNQNSHPCFPSWRFRTPICPLCSSTSDFAMAKPSPEPPDCELLDGSVLKKRSNIRN